MKYVFIENHRAEFSVKAMYRVLRVARSGWYVWCLRRHQISPHQQFRLTCDAAVRQTFTEAKQRYGSPRLADELPEYNIKTIAASLRRQGLRAKATRKFSPVSYREHGLPVSENLLKQDFYASGPNQKWAGDITYQNGLAKALREIGRIERTLFMLDWFRDPALRRRVQAGLNKGEARNALARAVFMHRLGEIRDRKPENQSYRASGLTLLTAAISLWNTVYMERAIDALKRKGLKINEQLLSHLSPLGWEHSKRPVKDVLRRLSCLVTIASI